MLEQIGNLAFALENGPRDKAAACQVRWGVDQGSRGFTVVTALCQDIAHGSGLGFVEVLTREKRLGKGVLDAR
jgi:hypothetical protein